MCGCSGYSDLDGEDIVWIVTGVMRSAARA